MDAWYSRYNPTRRSLLLDTSNIDEFLPALVDEGGIVLDVNIIAISQIMYPLVLLFPPSAVMIEDAISGRRCQVGFGLLFLLLAGFPIAKLTDHSHCTVCVF